MADPTAPDGRPRPLTCVVIEGYNESKEQGVADDTMAALAGQDYPLDRVHVVLVGSDDQVREQAGEVYPGGLRLPRWSSSRPRGPATTS